MKGFISKAVAAIRAVSVVSIIAFAIFLFATAATGQDVRRLQDQRVSIAMKDAAFGKVISYLTNKYDLSFGVELIPGDDENLDFQIPLYRSDGRIFVDARTKFTLELTDAKLPDVMDAIVSQMDGYRWEIADDVVDIFPSKGRDERLSKLMEIDIDSFAMSKESDLLVGKIMDCIIALPELKEFEKANNVEFSRSHFGDHKPLFRPFGEFRQSKISLRQLLNKAALAKKGNWRIIINDSTDRSSESVIRLEI